MAAPFRDALAVSGIAATDHFISEAAIGGEVAITSLSSISRAMAARFAAGRIFAARSDEGRPRAKVS